MKGFLILEDKTIIKGKLFGYSKKAAGEVVFTTGMVGYPQTLTDPSFKGQIIVFTFPLIGNYGIPSSSYQNKLIKNFQSGKIQAEGIVISCKSQSSSHWQAKLCLEDWLKKNKIPGLFEIDTRMLTKKLRQKGTMLGRITNHKTKQKKEIFFDPNRENLVEKVSCRQSLFFPGGKKKVLLLDCGVKQDIIRSLQELKATVIQTPWNFDPFVNNLKFDGLVISNGPGDPQKVKKTIATVRKIIIKNKPILGICLGHQILALAAGGQTYKLKYGHRSQNQPCLLTGTNKAFITSQNHGFAVKSSSLPKNWKEWFVNLNDQTCEGIIHNKKPFAGVQFHPEACPGPTDTKFILEKFLSWL